MIKAAEAKLFPVELKDRKDSQIERPPVSLSMAGHCRMEIWLAAHGYPKEAALPGTQRTFDKGHVDEILMFDGIYCHDPESGTTDMRGPWWKTLGVIVDYSTGEQLNTEILSVQNRQDEVELFGLKGHIDGIIGPEPMLVVDCKSMPGLTFKKNLSGNLMENPFSRENVFQVRMYVEAVGLKYPGIKVDGGILLLYNRENSRVAFRRIPNDPAILEEGKERLAWADSPAEPVPDWEWVTGMPIPLRCSYCAFRAPCAETRGKLLELQTTRDGPKWIVR